VLNAERAGTVAYWDGNLDHFALRASNRPGELAAMVVAEDGQARAWMNLRHCHAQAWPLIWLRLRRSAGHRACTLLWASDLAALVVDDEQQASSA
jgi:hypothetical protein